MPGKSAWARREDAMGDEVDAAVSAGDEPEGAGEELVATPGRTRRVKLGIVEAGWMNVVVECVLTRWVEVPSNF